MFKKILKINIGVDNSRKRGQIHTPIAFLDGARPQADEARWGKPIIEVAATLRQFNKIINNGFTIEKRLPKILVLVLKYGNSFKNIIGNVTVR